MKDSVRLLRECETGGKMALDWIDRTQEEIEDIHMQTTLNRYREKYSRFCQQVEREMSAKRRRAKELPPGKRAGVWMKLHTGLLLRHTDSEIASMISDACFTQTKRLSHAMNQCPRAEQNSIALTRELILLQQQCAEELREFL